MDMNNKKENKEGLIYDMYGIFSDYLIDTNQYMKMNGPVYNYENFQTWKKWEVAKILIEGKMFLIVDIDLKPFSYCRYIQHEKIALKSGLNSEEALAELKSHSNSLGIDILDQMDFYLRGGSMTKKKTTMVVNNHEITIDSNEKNLMICRLVEEGQKDKLALVRDVFGNGWLDDTEVRIDDNYYDEEEGLKKLNELSKELGLEIYEL